jgi:hypothetical protein
VKAAVGVAELRQKFVETLPPVIAKAAQPASCRAGALMELALMIDPHLANPTPEWTAFRSTAIAKWQTRSERASKEGKPTTGGPKIIDDGMPAPAAREPRASLQKADASNDGFPAFDKPAKGPTFSAHPFRQFLELINHPCWDYTGPSPAELFGQKDRFSTVDEAFAFLVNQS